MTKPKYREETIEKLKKSHCWPSYSLAHVYECGFENGYRNFESDMIDLQEQCDRLANVAENVYKGIMIPGGSLANEIIEMKEALAEYRKWKNNKGE